MPLEVRPCGESDYAHFARIQMAAFNGPLTGLMWPSPMTDEFFQTMVQKHTTSATEPNVYYLKVVDTDRNDEILGCAKWRFNEKELTEEEMESTLPVPGKAEEGRPAMQDLIWYLNRMRRQFMGRKPFARKQSTINTHDNSSHLANVHSASHSGH